MIKRFISAVALATMTLTASANCQTEMKLDNAQMETFIWAYRIGAPYGLSETLVTFAYKESSLGKYLINAKTSDYGVFMINLNTAWGLLKPSNMFQKYSIIPQKLMEDRELNARLSIETLMFWKKYRKGNYEMMIRSYNKGHRPQRADQYWGEFRDTYYKLKSSGCFPKVE